MSIWSHFLAATVGYGIRAYNDQRRATRADQVCFTRTTPDALPDQVAAQAEELLARGAQVMLRRVEDVIQIAFTDADTGELLEIIETTSGVVGPEQAYDEGEVIDAEFEEVTEA